MEMHIMALISPNHYNRQGTRRHITGDDRHKRAVAGRLQPPWYRHGSSRLRNFGEEMDQ
jgi:hypothetical protein